jgi:hypothetical protein
MSIAPIEITLTAYELPISSLYVKSYLKRAKAFRFQINIYLHWYQKLYHR